jgi:putative glutamine amidotransferase
MVNVTRPRIGMGAYPRTVDIVTGPTLLHTANRFYVDSVVRGGGVPVVLPVLAPALAGDALRGVDGLVLTGGGDVDPDTYGQEPEEETHGVDASRDAWEVALLLVALDRHIPVLATCRGIQVLNVALGGTLVQHVPAATGVGHGFAGQYAETVHVVHLDPACRLAALLGTTEVQVNSLHHQAVDVAGAGVRAVGWAPDGTVEAVEVDGHPELVAVQWHPELLEDDAVHQGLFRALVERAVECTDARKPT